MIILGYEIKLKKDTQKISEKSKTLPSEYIVYIYFCSIERYFCSKKLQLDVEKPKELMKLSWALRQTHEQHYKDIKSFA